MNAAPDASVVIAAWNAAGFIGRAIESALAQKDVSVEVVVADDASTDATVELVEGMRDGRVRCLAASRNGGPGAARNRAIANARGRWVAVLDADDAIVPDRLARLVDLGETEAADIVADNILVDGTGGAAGPMFAPGLLAPGWLDLPRFILSNRPFRGRFNLGFLKPVFRRRFLLDRELCYDESLRIGEDYVFLAEALAAGGRCRTSAEAGYLYSVRGDSISRRLRPNHVAAMMAADAALLERRPFGPAALAAQRRRTRALADAAAFLTAIEKLKGRSWAGACLALARRPGAARHLRHPLAVRARRLLARDEEAAGNPAGGAAAAASDGRRPWR